jgi:putative acetyltransferase
VEAGLEKCVLLLSCSEAADRMGEPLVVVLGHRKFYPRFGFEPSVRYGIEPPFPVDEAVFMVRPLPGYSPELRGRIVYPPAFAGV